MPAARSNQRARTRKDLLTAAARLMREGRTPDMDDVAREAQVSRATAYRYFPTIEALLIEAPVDTEVPDAASLFAGDAIKDPVARVQKAERAMHEVVYRNQAQLRLMLAASVTRAAERRPGVPLRQNRRSPLIAAALEPARRDMPKAVYERLAAALALVVGTESMIVMEDVLGLDEKRARDVKSWMIEALVQAAISTSAGRKR
jgi:AcrR family transcriptional regulator